MRILAIETSCDETAIAILEGNGGGRFIILGNALASQVEIHKEYGGVFPALAKREHAKNLVPLLEAALKEAELLHEGSRTMAQDVQEQLLKILEREPGLGELFIEFISHSEVPAIDAIAVTHGPGLEPALWVGVNFAKALSLAWGKSIVAVNHMEGHILAGLAEKSAGKSDEIFIGEVKLPLLALLISGGHTELVLMREWMRYELIGQTRDDAVGEAFDKVARMLGLPYPGGPEISRLAEQARTEALTGDYKLPRPMIDSDNHDFSFAGLKTAVLYLLKKNPEMSEDEKKHVAQEFEDAVTEVLWKKTAKALEHTNARTLVIGGGVSANTHIRRMFTENIKNAFPAVTLRIPARELTTDNAVMIALAAFTRAERREYTDADILRADGNLSLA